MPAETIDSKSFEEMVKGDKPVLVDFFATWCGPCQMMLPIVDEVAEEAEGFKVAKLDIDQSPDIAGKYNVMSVPTFIVFKDGKEADRVLGGRPKEDLVAMIKKHTKE